MEEQREQRESIGARGTKEIVDRSRQKECSSSTEIEFK